MAHLQKKKKKNYDDAVVVPRVFEVPTFRTSACINSTRTSMVAPCRRILSCCNEPLQTPPLRECKQTRRRGEWCEMHWAGWWWPGGSDFWSVVAAIALLLAAAVVTPKQARTTRIKRYWKHVCGFQKYVHIAVVFYTQMLDSNQVQLKLSLTCDWPQLASGRGPLASGALLGVCGLQSPLERSQSHHKQTHTHIADLTVHVQFTMYVRDIYIVNCIMVLEVWVILEIPWPSANHGVYVCSSLG